MRCRYPQIGAAVSVLVAEAPEAVVRRTLRTLLDAETATPAKDKATAPATTEQRAEWLVLRDRVRATGISYADLAAAAGYVEVTIRLALEQRKIRSQVLVSTLAAWLEQHEAQAAAPGVASPPPFRPRRNGTATDSAHAD